MKAWGTRLLTELEVGDALLMTDLDRGRDDYLIVSGMRLVQGYPVLDFTDGTSVVVTEPNTPIMVWR